MQTIYVEKHYLQNPHVSAWGGACLHPPGSAAHCQWPSACTPPVESRWASKWMHFRPLKKHTHAASLAAASSVLNKQAQTIMGTNPASTAHALCKPRLHAESRERTGRLQITLLLTCSQLVGSGSEQPVEQQAGQGLIRSPTSKGATPHKHFRRLYSWAALLMANKPNPVFDQLMGY